MGPRINHNASFWPVSLLVAGLLTFSAVGTAAAAPLFLEVSQAAVAATGYPETSRYFTLDLATMRAELAAAPRESFTASVPGLALELPLPAGGSERFEVWESPIMHPDLAAQFPEIKTYVGRGLDDRSATVRLDTTPAGFHAMILSTRPTIFIDPVHVGNARDHVSHFKRSRAQVMDDPREVWTCDFVEDPEMAAEIERLATEREAAPGLRTGEQLRTYRAAVAATGEYTQFHGGTVNAGQAAIVVSMNRVTGIYERELSVRMELIPNNSIIVYTNPATDPYSNGSGGTMLGQNQANLDAVIGNANYDIGHVFSTGGGGVAGLGVVCRAGNKARGVTGLTQPVGDIFDVDFVSHEMGHQYGGSHTFNGNAGNCAGGNRTASSAYEPGSGSTIMAYAGICGSQNIQNSSDDYFHLRSFIQITAYTQSGSGSTCPVVTGTGNNPPVPVAGNVGFTIPVDTPFILDGTATDPDGDDVTYCWEQYDLGPAGHPDTPSGNAPIFRSFDPKNQGARMFPKPPDVRNNTHTIGELLPTYARTLHFRLTARDNLGGVDWDATSVDVDDGSGPFLVTAIGPEPWDGGTQRTVTWDVAGTDTAPVSCSTVNIMLSTNGGRAFDFVLAIGEPNDGSAVVTVPGVSTLEGRVKVEAADNLFFDMNNDNFEVTGNATGVEQLAGATVALEVRPNPFASRASVAFTLDRRDRVAVDVFDPAGRRVATLVDGVRDAGAHSVEWSGRDHSGSRVAAGVYFVRMQAAGEVHMTRVVHLK